MISHTFSQIRSLLRDPLYLLLRVYFGIGIATFGYSKLLSLQGTAGYFGSLGLPVPIVAATLCTAIELAGGVLLALGLFTEYASFFVSCNMLIAILLGHRAEITAAFPYEPWHVVHLNAFRYLLVTLFLFLHGPGRFSLDFWHRTNAFQKQKLH
jgi:uncharacterized membrane protein YphA (DoxX/SURF4 family)